MAGTWRARRIIKAAVRLTSSVVVVVGGGGACGVAVATWAVSILSSRVTTSEKAGRRAGSWAQHCFTRFRISGDARRSCVRARVGKSQSTRPPQATTSHPTLNAHRAATPMHGSSQSAAGRPHLALWALSSGDAQQLRALRRWPTRCGGVSPASPPPTARANRRSLPPPPPRGARVRQHRLTKQYSNNII
eukprot:COSAG01_NODE_6437_length_3668_cov_1.448865_5_plen_190_part_00